MMVCLHCSEMGLPGALCPRHAATDELLAACREVKSRFFSVVPEESWYASTGPRDLLRQVEAAVAAAEGKEVAPGGGRGGS